MFADLLNDLRAVRPTLIDPSQHAAILTLYHTGAAPTPGMRPVLQQIVETGYRVLDVEPSIEWLARRRAREAETGQWFSPAEDRADASASVWAMSRELLQRTAPPIDDRSALVAAWIDLFGEA